MMLQKFKIEKPSAMTAKLFSNLMLLNILAKFSSSVVAVIDASITGKFLGALAVAAGGFASTYFFMITLIGRWLATGCQNLCSGELGKGRTDDANTYFNTTFFLTALISIIISAAGTVFAAGFTDIIGADPSSARLFSLGTDYMRGLFPGAPFYILSMILIPILQLDGDTRRVRASIITLTIADIAGDLMNVLLLHGGMLGMGLTTSVSQAAQFFILFSHFFAKGNTLHLRREHINIPQIVPVLRTGQPTAFNSVGLILLSVFLNRFTFRIGGEDAMVALAIMKNVSGILGICGAGVFSTDMLLGKICCSEMNSRMLCDIEHLTLAFIFAAGGLITLITFAGAPLIVSLYLNNTDSAFAASVTVIQIYSLSLIFEALVDQECAFLLAFDHVTFSSCVNLASTYVSARIFCRLLGHLMGTEGIWWGFPVSFAVLYILVLVIVTRKNGIMWKYRKKLHDPDFSVLEADIKDMQEAMERSEEVRSFCLAKGIDRRRAFHISLCYVELVENVLEYGFDPAKKNHLETRIIIDGDDLTLRMRDDCRLFDFKKQMDDWKEDPEHREKNLGIRIVRGMAKEVSYTGVFRTNNLIITF